jgi:PDZ domain-containing secreted protein
MTRGLTWWIRMMMRVGQLDEAVNDAEKLRPEGQQRRRHGLIARRMMMMMMTMRTMIVMTMQKSKIQTGLDRHGVLTRVSIQPKVSVNKLRASR